MAKKKPAAPALWVAVWKNVWMIDPVTSDPTTRKGRLSTFTVADTKMEAIATMRGDSLWFDDIEDVGDLESIKRLDVPVSEVPPAVAVMLQCGGRFIIPQRRMSDSLKALIVHLLIVQ